MSTLMKAERVPEPVAAKVTGDTLSVDLADGRTIAVPLAWFPRLLHGTAKERANFELGRNGVHWPELDEDIPVAGLLNGEKSGETLTSIRRWLERRQQIIRQRNGGKKLKESTDNTRSRQPSLTVGGGTVIGRRNKTGLMPKPFG